MEELLPFLSNSNPSVRYATVQHLSAFTSTHESREELFKVDAITPLVKLMSDIPSIAAHVLACLTNLAEDHNIAKSMMEKNKIISRLVDCIVDYDAGGGDGKEEDGKKSSMVDLYASLLSNLTILPEGCGYLEKIDPFRLYKLVHTLLHHFIQHPSSHPSIGMALVNIVQVKEVRSSFLQKGQSGDTDFPLFDVFGLIRNNHLPVRRVAIGIVYNCSFDYDYHGMLLKAGLLEFLLAPLRGEGFLSEEDRIGLPISLHHPLGPIEADSKCKSMILELLQLMTYHRESRVLLRDRKVYPILRELDRFENEEAIKEAICNLVQILVNEEEDGEEKKHVGEEERKNQKERRDEEMLDDDDGIEEI